jgi:hypothetical protein
VAALADRFGEGFKDGFQRFGDRAYRARQRGAS